MSNKLGIGLLVLIGTVLVFILGNLRWRASERRNLTRNFPLGLLPHVLMSEVRQHMYYNKKIEGGEGVFWASTTEASIITGLAAAAMFNQLTIIYMLGDANLVLPG